MCDCPQTSRSIWSMEELELLQEGYLLGTEFVLYCDGLSDVLIQSLLTSIF